MTDANSSPATPDDSTTTNDDLSFSIDKLDDAAVADIIENTRVENGDSEMPLKAAMLDLAVAHKELEEYKEGALAMYQHLDERLHEAEAAGNDEVAHVLREVKKTAYGVYLRLHRGDAELVGDRGGKFADYFDPDEPTPTPEMDAEEVADGAS
jgi:hypothetical protein